MNIVILTGNLGRDPELRYTQSGTTIANMNIATTERYKGEAQTEWHRLVAFGNTAEFAGNYLKKGSKVGIQGKIQTRQWEKDGQKQYTTEIVVDKLEFLDSKPKQESHTPPQSSGPPEIDADDIPF